MNWDSNYKQQVKRLFLDGSSYAEITKQLNDEGLNVTKSAVKHVVHNEVFDKGLGKRTAIKEQDSVQTKKSFDDKGNVRAIDFDIKFEDFRSKSDKTPKELLEFAGYDINDWVIVNSTSNDWSVTNGKGEKYWNHQAKISVKPKTNDELTTDDLIKLFNQKIEPVKLIKNNSFGKHNLVIAISDFHFGITQFEDIKEHFEELINLIRKGWQQIWIVQLNDLIHSDALNTSKTTKGTILDPIDFPKAISDAEKFMFPVVEESYKNSEETHMFSVNANHDETVGYLFEEMLRVKYPQIDIQVNNEYRQVFTVGKSVGIIALHGHSGKVKAPMLFATEAPEIWANSTYRMALYGHFHKEQVNDDFGLVEHQVGTFKTTDPYESKNGYTMATKKMECFEFDDETLKSIHYI
ncbi:hypothetical protein ACKP2L_05370 [Oenococcus alcoholitolerans]|uniref:hypothetical protein n=1 Tax=Oenococcus alcoholitolerans TaxID=931074 RepID=UPI003F70E5EB